MKIHKLGNNFEIGTYKKLCPLLLVSLIYCSPYAAATAVASNNSITQQDVNQALMIKGTVIDSSGDPVIGASIQIKGTTSGTITDIDGNFTINGTNRSVIRVTYIGYEAAELRATPTMRILLKEDTGLLDEVIVVGYGTAKRANLAGSVSSVQSKELEDIPMKDLASTLMGTMPGVNVGEVSGSPTANAKITIRTSGSWNAEEPLYVIDGFIRDAEAFNVLDPSEVENISILKDASAAVYGSRASGGVILVTTKRGKEGKTKVTYSGSYGVSIGSNVPEMMSAYEHASTLNQLYDAQYRWDATEIANNANKYFTADELQAYQGLNHDWLGMGWKNSGNTRHTLNVNGGSDRVKYFVGGSYMWQDGNFKNLNTNRVSARIGVDAKLTKNLNASFNLNFSNKQTELPYNNNDAEPDRMYGTFGSLLRTPRWLPAYIDGRPVGNNVSQHALAIFDSGSYNRNNSNSLAGGMNFDYNIEKVKGLKASVAFNYSNSNSYSKRVAKSYDLYYYQTEGTNNHIISNTPVEGNGYRRRFENAEGLQESSSFGWSYQINPSISYNRSFGKHDLSTMVMFEQSESRGNSLSGQRRGVLIDNYEIMAGFLTEGQTLNSTMSNGARQSFIGRFNYAYNQKYFLEATARYEGSSTFHPDTRWGIFSSFSAGWRISEESWFKENVTFMDNMKLRASYGRLGNDKGNIRAWEQSYQISSGNPFFGYGDVVLPGLEPKYSGVLGTIVTWEKSDSYNVGLDTRFFNALSFSVDAFYRHTFDILDTPTSLLPQTAGIVTDIPKQNFGIQNAWGGEIEIGYQHKFNKDWSAQVRGQIAFADNKVIRKYQSPGVVGTWKDENGRRRGGEVGYLSMGLARTEEDCINYINYLKGLLRDPNDQIEVFGKKEADLMIPGYVMFKDIRGSNDRDESPDGKITEFDQTHITSRDSNPFNYGFTLGFKWKNLSVDGLFNGAFGTQVCYEKAFYENNSGGKREGAWLSDGSNNLREWYNNYWTPENPNAKYPKLHDGFKDKRSTFWVQNGHVLRLRNINVSYNMPKNIASAVGLEQLRVYFTGTNLWTIVNPYSYKDAGVSIWSDYPMIRTFNFGVNLTF